MTIDDESTTSMVEWQPTVKMFGSVEGCFEGDSAMLFGWVAVVAATAIATEG